MVYTFDSLDLIHKKENKTYVESVQLGKTLDVGLEISLHSSLRDRVKWDLGLRVNCLALEKPTYRKGGGSKLT